MRGLTIFVQLDHPNRDDLITILYQLRHEPLERILSGFIVRHSHSKHTGVARPFVPLALCLVANDQQRVVNPFVPSFLAETYLTGVCKQRLRACFERFEPDFTPVPPSVRTILRACPWEAYTARRHGGL